MPDSLGSTAIPISRPCRLFAWLDPMCGMMLAFIVAAGIWQRRQTGSVARIDFSMIEASMLWTMADPLLATQCDAPPEPQGNRSDSHVPHGAWRCTGDDDWISVAVSNDEQWRNLCAMVAELAPMTALNLGDRIARRDTIEERLAAWLRLQTAQTAADTLLNGGVPAAALANAVDLVASSHLRERGFWEPHGTGVLPGLPWRASFGRASGTAPTLGADTHAVLSQVLGRSPEEIAALRQSGALG